MGIQKYMVWEAVLTAGPIEIQLKFEVQLSLSMIVIFMQG